MKITKQRLREIIKEELSTLKEEPTGEERAVLAASKEFIQYLKSQGLSDMSHPTIKKHLIDLGLPPSVAGQYALFSAQTFKTPERMVQDAYEKEYPQEYDELEEVIQSGGKPPKPADQHSEVSYDPTKLTRKTFHKKSRKDAKQAIKKGDIDEAIDFANQCATAAVQKRGVATVKLTNWQVRDEEEE